MRITGGVVVRPEGAQKADVVVADGRIAAIEPPSGGGGDVDARGCVVLPGGVDPHTHLLSDPAAAGELAAHGGTTTALSFTAPQPGESPAEAWLRARDELLPLAAVDVFLNPSIWEPERLIRDDLVELKELGARSVKLFTAYRELGMQASDRTLYEALRDAGGLGLLTMVHCENGDVIAALVAEHLAAGRCEARYFAACRPPEVEVEAVGRVLTLAGLARSPVYLVHLSTAGALDLVRAARARGQTVFAEACIHHLVLDEEGWDERFLVAPPLRARADLEALWAGVADGTLDTVGSDHAQVPYQPPPADDFTGIAYGFRGVEERLPLLLSEGRRRGVPIERLVEVACGGPARTFGLYPWKGAIVPGADADLVVWDPDEEWTIEGDSPYAGLTVSGRIRSVLRSPGTKTPVPLAGPT